MGSTHLKAWRWGAVAAWAVVIFAASSLPGSGLPGGYSVEAHFVEYFVLGWLLFGALKADRETATAVALTILIASVYAVTDEVHQSFVPMRVPDWRDWLTDTVGAAAGAGGAALFAWLRQRRRSDAADARQ